MLSTIARKSLTSNSPGQALSRKRAVSLVQPSPIKGFKTRPDSADSASSISQLTSDPIITQADTMERTYPRVPSLLHRGGLEKTDKDILKQAYPTYESTEENGAWLKIRFSKLPPKPWPVSIGGMPAIFVEIGSQNEHDWPFLGLKGTGAIILKDLRIDYRSEELSFHAVQAISLAIPLVTRLTFFGHHLRLDITLEHEQFKANEFPARIGNILVSYSLTSSLKQALSKQRRRRVVGSVADDSDYAPDMTPGCMLGTVFRSPEHRTDRLGSTTGIAVMHQDRPSTIHILCAAHTFRHNGRQVQDAYHPSDTGHYLGNVTSADYTSDIAIVRLAPNLNYNNRNYFNLIGSNTQLSFGIPPRYSNLVFDSPYSGPVFSQFTAVSIDAYRPGDQDVVRIMGVVCWIGSGTDYLLDGVCGSTLVSTDLDEEDFRSGVLPTGEQKIVAQFHLYDEKAQLIYCPSLAGLRDEGYSIA